MKVDPTTPRMAGESARAYASLIIYRNLGPNRTIEQARKCIGIGSRSKRVLEGWSGQFKWVDRSCEWDAQRQAVVDRAEARVAAQAAAKWAATWEIRRLQTLTEAWADAGLLRSKGLEMLSAPVLEATRAEDGSTALRPVGRWNVKTAVDAIRAAHAIRCEITAATTPDLSQLSREELQAIADVQCPVEAEGGPVEVDPGRAEAAGIAPKPLASPSGTVGMNKPEAARGGSAQA